MTLKDAIINGQEEWVARFSQGGKEVLNQVSGMGENLTFLRLALRHGHEKIFNILAQK